MITNISTRMAGITRMARMEEEEEKNISWMDRICRIIQAIIRLFADNEIAARSNFL